MTVIHHTTGCFLKTATKFRMLFGVCMYLCIYLHALFCECGPVRATVPVWQSETSLHCEPQSSTLFEARPLICWHSCIVQYSGQMPQRIPGPTSCLALGILCWHTCFNTSTSTVITLSTQPFPKPQ